MQIVSGDNLRGQILFSEKIKETKNYQQFVVCWTSLESDKCYKRFT